MKLTMDTLIELNSAASVILEVIPSQDQDNVEEDIKLLLQTPVNLAKFTTGLYRLRANLAVMKQCEMAIVSPAQQPKETISGQVTQVIKLTASSYGVTVSEIRGRTRTKNITEARHVAMWILRKITDLSLTDIGLEFGRICHTTVISALDRVNSSDKLQASAQRIMERIQI